MDFVSAAIEVLRRSGRPLTIEEITAEALRLGLLTTRGKTPQRTMAAQLYLAARDRPSFRLQRIFEPGRTRARRGSVRWTLHDRHE